MGVWVALAAGFFTSVVCAVCLWFIPLTPDVTLLLGRIASAGFFASMVLALSLALIRRHSRMVH